MNPLIQLKKTTPVFLIAVVLICFALLPRAQAQLMPTPDGQYMNDNTAEGGFTVLFHLSTGAENTAIGVNSMFLETTGNKNTAVGDSALKRNTSGNNNTATGIQALFNNTTASNNTADGNVALFSNTTGTSNTATGTGALFSNSTASGNTADGFFALNSNTSGGANTAVGSQALVNNTKGIENTAIGFKALLDNTTLSDNTAVGVEALEFNTRDDNTAVGAFALEVNTTGMNNTAVGSTALDQNTTGSRNIALGAGAGDNLGTGAAGDDNIDIGNFGGGSDTGTIRIGTQGTQGACFIAGIHNVAAGTDAVLVDANGQLGTGVPSSARFKTEIKPMDKSSEAILALKPVTFRYKKEIDPKGMLRFGLVAEEVEKVNPELVGRDATGQVSSVRYDAVNAMLLNEFLKEHKTVQEQGATIARLQKQIETLTAGLQKVSAEVELQKPSAQTVVNNQ